MQIAINLDLPAIIAKAVSAERIQPIVDKAVSDAVKSAIDGATGYHSEFRTALKDQLSAAMPHGLEIRDVVKFQHILNEAMNKLTHEFNTNAIHTALENAAKDVLPDVPPVIGMRDLLKEARAGFSKDANEAFYAYYEPSDLIGGGWLHLDGDPNPGSRSYSSYSSSHRSREEQRYSARYILAFNSDGIVYSLRLDGKQVTPAARPDIVGHLPAILMAMYVGRTRIAVDMDASDVEYAAQEQYD